MNEGSEKITASGYPTLKLTNKKDDALSQKIISSDKIIVKLGNLF